MPVPHYDADTGIARPDHGLSNPDVPLNLNFGVLLATQGVRACRVQLRPAEYPTATTTLVRVASGNVLRPDGSVGAFAGDVSYALPPSQTTAIWLDRSLALQQDTAFPAAGAFAPLALVTTDATKVTGIVDARLAVPMAGPRDRPITYQTGTVVGTLDDSDLSFDASSAACSYTLPAAAWNGKTVCCKLLGANGLTVVAPAGTTIDAGLASIGLGASGQVMTFVYDGAGVWLVMGN